MDVKKKWPTVRSPLTHKILIDILPHQKKHLVTDQHA